MISHDHIWNSGDVLKATLIFFVIHEYVREHAGSANKKHRAKSARCVFFFVSRVLRIHIYMYAFFFLILTRHDSVVGNRDRGKMGYVIATAILR